MDQKHTAKAIISLALKSGVDHTNLSSFIEELIRIAYVNPEFVNAMFRAKNMIDAHDCIRELDWLHQVAD